MFPHGSNFIINSCSVSVTGLLEGNAFVFLGDGIGTTQESVAGSLIISTLSDGLNLNAVVALGPLLSSEDVVIAASGHRIHTGRHGKCCKWGAFGSAFR